MKKTPVWIMLSGIMLSVFILHSCQQPQPAGLTVDEDRVKNHIIPNDTAQKYIRNYLAALNELNQKVDEKWLRDSFNLAQYETFDKNAMIKLAAVGGADSVRIYYGMDDGGKLRFVLFAVDKNGKDIHVPLGSTIREQAVGRAAPPDPNDAIEVGQRYP